MLSDEPPCTYRGEGKGSDGIAVRLARRLPRAAAAGLFPSMRHSSVRRRGAAALERRLRGSCCARQQHRIARRRGRGTASAPPPSRSDRTAAPRAPWSTRPSSHATERASGAAAAAADWLSGGGGGSPEARGRVLKGRWRRGKPRASSEPARERLIANQLAEMRRHK